MWAGVRGLSCKMNVVFHSVHCTHTFDIPIAPSSLSVKRVVINDGDRAREHLPESLYTHAALRSHACTAVPSLTYPQPYLFALADRRNVLGCLVFLLRVLQVIVLFPDSRSVLKVAVQHSSRAVFGDDENPPPTFGDVHLLLCYVLRAHCRQAIMCPSRASSTVVHFSVLQPSEPCSTISPVL